MTLWDLLADTEILDGWLCKIAIRAPRADISLDYGSDTHRCRVRNTLTAEILASAFRGSEARGQDWLKWWESS